MKEKELLDGKVYDKKIQLKCDRILFYIFMLSDMYHDYFTNVRTNIRGSIVHKIYSFYETINIVFSNIEDLEKKYFVNYFEKLKETTEKILKKEQIQNHSKYPSILGNTYYLDKTR